ncbi:hypothetical protein IWQ60_005651 [Tieghemiomyces parasiticus]|uniref:Uncharacterized protein n=1 Tax=Tieghemiomyces parasiticus TaxID=78921 RepID=A0A9W8A8R5_9FUNG|nr:hypothetical protein IWQ60_005651 [Tieghemiomyces parasiticus]
MKLLRHSLYGVVTLAVTTVVRVESAGLVNLPAELIRIVSKLADCQTFMQQMLVSPTHHHLLKDIIPTECKAEILRRYDAAAHYLDVWDESSGHPPMVSDSPYAVHRWQDLTKDSAHYIMPPTPADTLGMLLPTIKSFLQGVLYRRYYVDFLASSNITPEGNLYRTLPQQGETAKIYPRSQEASDTNVQVISSPDDPGSYSRRFSAQDQANLQPHELLSRFVPELRRIHASARQIDLAEAAAAFDAKKPSPLLEKLLVEAPIAYAIVAGQADFLATLVSYFATVAGANRYASPSPSPSTLQPVLIPGLFKSQDHYDLAATLLYLNGADDTTSLPYRTFISEPITQASGPRDPAIFQHYFTRDAYLYLIRAVVAGFAGLGRTEALRTFTHQLSERSNLGEVGAAILGDIKPFLTQITLEVAARAGKEEVVNEFSDQREMRLPQLQQIHRTFAWHGWSDLHGRFNDLGEEGQVVVSPNVENFFNTGIVYFANDRALTYLHYEA